MSKTLDDLRTSTPRPRGCQRCGKPTVAILQVGLRERPARGKSGAGPTVVSRSISLCEPCAVDVYAATLAALFGGDTA